MAAAADHAVTERLAGALHLVRAVTKSRRACSAWPSRVCVTRAFGLAATIACRRCCLRYAGHNGQVLSVTEGEAQERAELLTDIGYEVFLDLAATPASSRTRVRFRCRRPGAGTFAQLDLAATSEVRLNGQPLPPPDGGRVRLAGLAAENVLVAGGVIADVGGMDPGLIRFTDPADGDAYVIADGFPD